MNFWTAIVIIVIVSAIARVLRARHYAQHGIMEDRLGRRVLSEPQRDAELQREVDELRQRITVLERIVTDGRQTHDLAREIESLRDK